jgi:hypothetical protein
MRKTVLSAFVLGLSLAGIHAATFNFDLTGPAGSGLLPGNAVPPAVGSTASGFEHLGGFTYDDVSKHLFVDAAWGSAFGGGDLVGNFVEGTLNGPATQSTAGPTLYTFNDSGSGYSPQDPGGFGKTGFIQYDVTLTDQVSYTVSQQEADLLSGKWYFNVASSVYPTGEIRGQLLTAVPEPQEYAMIAGLGLVGFACYRRHKSKSAPVLA